MSKLGFIRRGVEERELAEAGLTRKAASRNFPVINGKRIRHYFYGNREVERCPFDRGYIDLVTPFAKEANTETRRGLYQCIHCKRVYELPLNSSAAQSLNSAFSLLPFNF